MVSRLPVFSGKRVGTRVPTELVGPVIVVVVLFVALLIAYPWVMLTAGTLAYLASLPFGYLSYRGYEQQLAREPGRKRPAAPRIQSPACRGLAHPPENEDRPSRLN